MRCLLLFLTILLIPELGAQQLVTPFPEVLGNQPFGVGRVTSLAVESNTLFIGGNFSAVDQEARTNLAAIDLTTGTVLDWSPVPDEDVRGLAATPEAIYVWGDFTNINGVMRNNLAALDPVTGAILDFNPDITFPGIPGMQTGTISDVLVLEDTIFLSGYFLAVEGQSRQNLAALLTDGTLLEWAPSTNIPNEHLAAVGDQIFVSGPFSSPRVGIAAFDRWTGATMPFNAQANNSGNTYGPMLSLPNGMVISGPFSQLAGQSRPYIGLVDPLTGSLQVWDPGLAYSNPVGVQVNALQQSGLRVFIGGDFSAASFPGRQNLAEVDSWSGAIQSWNPAPNGKVEAMAISDDKLCVGGWFSSIGGQPRERLACFDLTVTTTDEMMTSSLKCSPNPAWDLVTVDGLDSETPVFLLDALGKVIRTWPADGMTSRLLYISDLPSGYYVLLHPIPGTGIREPLVITRP